MRRREAAERRRAIARRRLTALGIAAALAFVVGVAIGGGGGGSERGGGSAPAATPAPEEVARKVSEGLPLTQQVGRLVVLRFAGTSAPGYVRRVLSEGRAAGAILFRDNLTGPDQAKRLASRLAQGADGPPLIMVDQEGGEIRILPWAPPAASQPQQAAAGTVGSDAEAAARAVRATGINVSLAPVGDVPSVDGAALAGRAFSTDFQAASQAMAESVRGWRKGGVAPTAKHFPGIGGAVTNTDDGPATIERSAQQIRDEDLAPFRAAIEAGVPLVMAGHALYPALDGERIASQSQPIIDGLLRDELGFKGVVITDSTEAAAVQAVTGVQEAAVRNIRAGVDIVLTTGRGSYIQVYRALLAEARRDPAFRERVKQSAERVVALQQSLR
ncbi:MAG TPA: glycoside hydrolase family 3 N-terminal domain-containing protein [Solirubrobacteraceae bacterium]|nr:glycoside hydrolase family 3 N-terminal domain-containing protein [Solirubrobacteraceae bacterium]